MTDTLCHQCGKPVPRFVGDYHYKSATQDGKPIPPNKRAGARMGSAWMSSQDAGGKFCTMRCAACWAIRHSPPPRFTSKE